MFLSVSFFFPLTLLIHWFRVVRCVLVPLPSPGRMSVRSPHARTRQNGDEEVESELEDSDREADNHGIDSDLESVTNAFVEGRLVARAPDSHSENSNSSVVDFEQLMRDINIPVDLNYFPPVSASVSPFFRPQSPTPFSQNGSRNPGTL